jgi:cell division transport system ATP-binding protein
MIVFHNVTKKYNSTAALEDINFKIVPGEFVSIVGKSGAGKSTIIKLLIGEERPSHGRILVGSYEVHKLLPAEFPKFRRQIGTIFQDFKLIATKTAYENIAFALEVEGRTENEIVAMVPQMLDMVGLSEKADNFPHELSGGEKQRVAIARAMIHRPAVIVADEPTGNLDDLNTEEIIKLLLKINELGTTVILASHNRHIVNHLSKRVIILADGRIIKDEERGRYTVI